MILLKWPNHETFRKYSCTFNFQNGKNSKFWCKKCTHHSNLSVNLFKFIRIATVFNLNTYNSEFFFQYEQILSFLKSSLLISNFLIYLGIHYIWMRKTEKVAGNRIGITIYSWKFCIKISRKNIDKKIPCQITSWIKG